MKNITVIGIGRLGLCTALIFEKNGYNVLGIDINEKYVESINNKTLKSYEPKINDYLNMSHNLIASTNLKEGIEYSDIIFISVQTPNSGNEDVYDCNILSQLLININKYKVENKIIAICCTVLPTYIDKIGTFLLSDCKNTFLNYNPEFIAQGNIINDFENPDMILIGEANKKSGNIIEDIYINICKSNPKIMRMKPLEAEIVKISVNGYITTKLSYANMISDLCDNMNVEKEIVLNAIGSDKRIGNKYFHPGYSFGGPCFPRDTYALEQVLLKNNINNNLIKSVEEYNELHVSFQTKQLSEQNKDNYIIENICFKEDSKIPIIEESAKLKIAEELVKKYNKSVTIKDELHLINLVKMKYGNIFNYSIK